MKQFYTFLIAVFSIFANAQNGTISIGNDNLVYPSMPVFSFYGFTYSQQIVSKAAFNAASGTAGEITKLRYYCVSSGSSITPWNNWTIYIGHTDKSVFQGGDWVPVSQMIPVFSGEFTPVAGSWIEFQFTTPFVYNNTDNIVIAVDENAPGWTAASNAAEFYSYFGTGNCGMRVISDSVNFDPENPIGDASLFSQVPMLQLEGQMLGLEDVRRSAVLVYPNPSDGIFNLQTDSEIISVHVFDLSGRLVESVKGSQTRIDLGRLQAAVYLVKVNTIDGTFERRIVRR